MIIEVTFNRRLANRARLMLVLLIGITAASGSMRANSQTIGMCGNVNVAIPFTDVAANSIFFCAIAEAYFSGLTNGTSATTYSPTAPVPREQMAAFITRTHDSALRRGSRRAALNQWWTPTTISASAMTTVGDGPKYVASDGDDLWVANELSDTVSRVRASDGKLLGTWTGAISASGVVVARGRIYVTGRTSPGKIYSIDPTQPPGPITLLTDDLTPDPTAIAYNGTSIWTANQGGSVDIVTFCQPPCVTAVTTGIIGPQGILYDGSHIWVTNTGDNTLKKLSPAGAVVQSVPVGELPVQPVFDGTNIWVPSFNTDTVTVVRVKNAEGNPLAQPFVLATLSGNGLDHPQCAAFDGQRILVTNVWGNSVSLWKAADLTPLGSFSTGANTQPFGACSDGINFWVTLTAVEKLARF
jgi:hypothetical protein